MQNFKNRSKFVKVKYRVIFYETRCMYNVVPAYIVIKQYHATIHHYNTTKHKILAP